IDVNGNLEDFLNTSKTIVEEYAKIIGKDQAENFFNKLSQFEKVDKSNFKALKDNDSEFVEETMKYKVENYFSFMLKEDVAKHKQIISNDDYDKLVDWITYYFENDFEVPIINNPIQDINTGKT